jgi:hypothetical protein
MVPERKLELVDKVTDLLKERMPTKAYCAMYGSGGAGGGLGDTAKGGGDWRRLW